MKKWYDEEYEFTVEVVEDYCLPGWLCYVSINSKAPWKRELS